MRTLLIAVLTIISAVLGGCVVALSTLVVNFTRSLHESHGIGAIAGSISGGAALAGVVVGGAAGYFLARAFLPRR